MSTLSDFISAYEQSLVTAIESKLSTRDEFFFQFGPAFTTQWTSLNLGINGVAAAKALRSISKKDPRLENLGGGKWKFTA